MRTLPEMVMVHCPACQQDVSGFEPPCPYCGNPLHPPAGAPTAASKPGDAASSPPAEQWVGVPVYTAQSPPPGARAGFSNVQPVWQFLLLQFCSFGSYYLIWFHQNWKLIKERKGWRITPAARAIFAIFWIRSLCQELYELAAEAGHKESRWTPEVIGTLFVFLALVSRPLERAPEPFSTLFMLGIFVGQVLLMLPVVHALNAYWRHEQPHLPVRSSLSAGAWIVVFLGGLVWLLGLVSMFVPEG